MIRSAILAALLLSPGLFAQTLPFTFGPPHRVTQDVYRPAGAAMEAVVADGDGAVVFWSRITNGVPTRLLARRVDADGRTVAADVEIPGAPHAAVARIPNGDFFLATWSATGMTIRVLGSDLRLKYDRLVSTVSEGPHDIACNSTRCAVATRRGVLDVNVTLFDLTGAVTAGPTLLAYADHAAVAAREDGFAVAIANATGSVVLVDNSGHTGATVALGPTYGDIDIVDEPAGWLVAYLNGYAPNATSNGVRLLPISAAGAAGASHDIDTGWQPSEIELSRNGAHHLLIWSLESWYGYMEGAKPLAEITATEFDDTATAGTRRRQVNLPAASAEILRTATAGADFVTAWQTRGFEYGESGVIVRARPMAADSSARYVQSVVAAQYAAGIAATRDHLAVLWSSPQLLEQALFLSVSSRSSGEIPPPIQLSPASSIYGAGVTSDGQNFVVTRMDLPADLGAAPVVTTVSLYDSQANKIVREIEVEGFARTPPVWTGKEYAVVVTSSGAGTRIVRIARDLRTTTEVAGLPAMQTATLVPGTDRVLLVWSEPGVDPATFVRSFNLSLQPIGTDLRILNGSASDLTGVRTSKGFIVAAALGGTVFVTSLSPAGATLTTSGQTSFGYGSAPVVVRVGQGTLISWMTGSDRSDAGVYLPDGSMAPVPVSIDGHISAAAGTENGAPAPVVLFKPLPSWVEGPLLAREVNGPPLRRRATR